MFTPELGPEYDDEEVQLKPSCRFLFGLWFSYVVEQDQSPVIEGHRYGLCGRNGAGGPT